MFLNKCKEPMKRVCGLDVHKDSIFVCILGDEGIIYQNKFEVLTPELEQMAGVMHSNGVQEVAMESTSIYWLPVWRVLDPYFDLKLVNPYFIKQLPGRKSDTKDAEWIATCLYKGLIRGSYVPAELIQQLRQYNRRIYDLNGEIVRKLAKLDNTLQRCNIRISNYLSTTNSKSYTKVVEMLSRGESDPDVLTKAIHGRTVNKWGRDVVKASLTGVVSSVDSDIIRQLREEVALAQRNKDECLSKMEALCRKFFPVQLDNLLTIPGVKLQSATAIIAEVGSDMSSFEDAPHLVSWCGLRPRNEESAGKILYRKITHGNKYIRKTLVECAWAASKTQGCFFSRFSYHQVMVRRKSKMKVIVAVARKILSAVWFVLHDGIPYRDFPNDIAPVTM